MALTAAKTWAQGDVLTAADLNTLNTNILNNPISLISPTTGQLDFNSFEAKNFAVEVLTSNPSAGSTGRIFMNSGTTQLMLDNGTTIEAIGPNTASTAGVGAVGSWVRGLEGTLSTNLGVFTLRQAMLQTSNADNSFFIASTAAFTVNSQTAGPIVNGR